MIQASKCIPQGKGLAAALLKRARGQESPKGCVAAVRAALTAPFDEGLLVERQQFTRLVEGEQSVEALVQAGHDRATVLRVWRMLDRAEYKRRQAPPGVKIGPRAFGRDRRYPITNGYTNLIA